MAGNGFAAKHGKHRAARSHVAATHPAFRRFIFTSIPALLSQRYNADATAGAPDASQLDHTRPGSQWTLLLPA
jgi:hypothetical protein